MDRSVGISLAEAVPGAEELLARYRAVRAATEQLCASLEIEDYVVQTMPDVSPTKWHLAHTSWFFEAFLLTPQQPGYRSPHPLYNFLFNSYYVQIGERFHRPHRGLLSRPTVAEVFDYRAHVDRHVTEFLTSCDDSTRTEILPTLILGLNHEQQHQELMLTDIKHVLSVNPLHPVFREAPRNTDSEAAPTLQWIPFEEGLYEIGYGGDGFAFDNEGPRHRSYVHGYQLADRLVTAGEYMEFIEDGGYCRAELWLSDGAAAVEAEGWEAPLYWERVDGRWHHFTLHGFCEVDPNEPVSHVSGYEADAFARWAGARLPSEAEWEIAAAAMPTEGNFVDSGRLHPLAVAGGLVTMDSGSSSAGTSEEHGRASLRNPRFHQMYGDVWEWTRSPYSPYPGYVSPPGAVGEYNGKFMANQMVLRGGSCATPQDHIRPTYRNFFPPQARWQFSGIRLAKDSGRTV